MELSLSSSSNKNKNMTTKHNIRRVLGSKRLFIYIALLFIVVGLLTIIRLVTQMRASFENYHYKSDTDFELVTLPQDFAYSRGARCLDGTPPGYYFRAGAVSSQFWIIHLLQGAWCTNVKECFERSLTRLGSSKRADTSITLNGMFSKDCKNNPQFCSWNVAAFLYCDGSSFLGNVSNPVNYKSQKLYSRGALNFDAVLEYLLFSTKLKQAEQVILTGSSAGGIAALIHADRLRTKLPPSIHSLHVVVDAAMFVDVPDIQGNPTLVNLFHNVYEFHNIKAAQSIQECATNPTDGWKCLFVSKYHSYVFTPVFFINSVFDVWQRHHALQIPCFEDTCPDHYIESVYTSRDAIHDLAKVVSSAEKNAIFLTHCPAHTLLNKWPFFELRMGNQVMREVLSAWLLHSKSPDISGSPLSLLEGIDTCGEFRHGWTPKLPPVVS